MTTTSTTITAHQEAVSALLDNPFDVEKARFAASISLISRRGIAEPLVRAAIERDDIRGAERILLATAHAIACAAPERLTQLYSSSDVLPPSLARALPHSRGDYMAIGAAAGRCLRALSALRGSSRAMIAVRHAIWAACFGDSLFHALVLSKVIHDHDVLILGETGTGKEGVAHAIQEGCLGPKDGSPAPRAALNVAAVPETLVAAELFGHVKGAFTGANETRLGRIRTAYGGSLFLDEVGDLAHSTQVKLLRVMETDEVSPLGSDKMYRAGCRYVAATHKDLDALVETGKFRRDLHQRLAGTIIRLPPLRDRPEDIRAIGHAFIERHLPNQALPTTRRKIKAWLDSEEATRHRWPGNVRELQNALRNLLLGLDPGIQRPNATIEDGGEVLPRALRECTATMDDVVDWYVRRVVEHTDQNIARASRLLGVDRNTVRRRLN